MSKRQRVEGEDVPPVGSRIVDTYELPSAVHAEDRARLLLALDHAYRIRMSTYMLPHTVKLEGDDERPRHTISTLKLDSEGFYDVVVSFPFNVIVRKERTDDIFGVDPDRMTPPTVRFNCEGMRQEVQFQLTSLRNLPPHVTTHRQIVTLYRTIVDHASQPLAASAGRKIVHVPPRRAPVPPPALSTPQPTAAPGLTSVAGWFGLLTGNSGGSSMDLS
jgi:hypothetical protein